jgi:hypothetical protein
MNQPCAHASDKADFPRYCGCLSAALKGAASSVNSTLVFLIARVGYVARGCLFTCIGVLSLFAALGLGGRTAGFQESVGSLLQGPVGGYLALFLGIGLLCFAIWRFIEAIAPSDHRAESLLQRVAFGASGLFYLGLTAWTLSAFFSATVPRATSDRTAREWTGWLLELPVGAVITGAIGFGLIITAVVFLVRALKPDFKSAVALHPKAPTFISTLGRYGLIARALVYAEIGGFLVYAAMSYSSREAKGLAGAFRSIALWEGGPIILSMTAAGFIAFGLYEFGAAIYRDLNPQRVEPDP